MSLEQSIGAIIVALIGAVGGIVAERLRSKSERRKELSTAHASIEQAKLADDALKRKEIDEAARDIREFLRKQVAELNEAIDRIEVTRADEREKWHQMLGTLSTKNLELELQHRRDVARIDEMLEEAKLVDDEIKTLKTRIAVANTEAIKLQARLDQCQIECRRLRKDQEVIKTLDRLEE